MISVSVKADVESITRKFASVSDPSSAVSRALNKTSTTVRAETARAIRTAGYKIKIGVIKRGLKVRRATRSTLRTAIDATGRPIPLIEYGAHAVKTHGGGVSVDVLHGRKMIPGVFVATMPNGHRGVCVRVG
jgi:hypothetical protein